MAKKAKKKEDIEAYWHEAETRKNAVPVGITSYDTVKHKPKKYEYDPHLAFLTNTNSLPFKLGKEKRIAVKVIDHRGNEVMVVGEMK